MNRISFNRSKNLIIKKSLLAGSIMNKSSSKGIKLTTVIFAVLVLALSAILSNTSIAGDMDVLTEQSN